MATATADTPLTMREQAFVDAYTGPCYGVGTHAYQAAYPHVSYDTARANASRLLASASVQHAIQARLSELAMSREETLARLTSIARGDSTGALKAIAEGADPTEALKSIDTRLIKRVRIQSGALASVDIELHDPLEALKVLAKWHNIGTTQHLEVTGAGGGPMLIKQAPAPPQPAITTLDTVEGQVRELPSGTQEAGGS